MLQYDLPGTPIEQRRPPESSTPLNWNQFTTARLFLLSSSTAAPVQLRNISASQAVAEARSAIFTCDRSVLFASVERRSKLGYASLGNDDRVIVLCSVIVEVYRVNAAVALARNVRKRIWFHGFEGTLRVFNEFTIVQVFLMNFWMLLSEGRIWSPWPFRFEYPLDS